MTTVDPSELDERGGRDAAAQFVIDWVDQRYGPCALGLFTDLERAQAFPSNPDTASR